MRGGDSGWREEMDSLPGGRNERAASGCYQCFPVLLLAMPPPWSSWAEGVGTARTVDRRPEGLGVLFFCKSWWRLRVLEPSHMNGGWEGRRRTETPWVEIRGFRVLCVFQKREGVSAILPRRSGPEEAGVGSAENPTPPPPANVHHALGTPIFSQRGNSSRKTGTGSSKRVQRGATG